MAAEKPTSPTIPFVYSLKKHTRTHTHTHTVANDSRTPSAATVAHSLLPPPSATPSQSSESTKVKKYESMKVEDIEN